MSPDLLIVGAGPAGLSAAVEATARGLSVLLLDENPAPGGRIWQALEARGASDRDDDHALALIQQARSCGADLRFRATVWAIEPDGSVFWSQAASEPSASGPASSEPASSEPGRPAPSMAGTAAVARPRRILLATGTTERPLPIPGWTLPGVMTVGAAQIALKTGGLVPDGGTWIAGQGPLLLLYAVQALKAGGDIAGIIDLSDPAHRLSAVAHLPSALLAAPDLAKGLLWRRRIAKGGVPWLRASALRAEGDGRLERIVLTAHGHTRTEAADTLLLHDGVIPSVQLSRAIGCRHVWSAAQRCWHPDLDAWGATSVAGIHVAGDGGGIAGAWAATCSGRLAALGIAHDLGRIDAATRDAAARPWRARRRRHCALRPFLDALYPPRPLQPDDATVICRCEEVTARDIRQAVAFGCLGPNQLKAYTRCGMGPCQGRTCAPIAAEVIAAARGVSPADVEPLRPRFPTKPLRLEELATLQET
ncbi:MAG: FAD-dependent oxidoreductase [Rhodospirillales bacterium]|nr:FAD-dependent oxidoreductase [Rhodospirillales bacterium]